MSDVQPAPCLFEPLEARLAVLDALPRALWLGGMTHAAGRLEPRLLALQAWRGALSQGVNPLDDFSPGPASDADWPAHALRAPLKTSFDHLQLARYCQAHADLADLVLQSLLFHLDLVVDYRDRGADEAAAARMAVEAFRSDWAERCGEIDELVAAFGELGDLLKNTRWDTLRGLLRSREWQDVVRIRKLVERLPELARVIRSLGRAQPVEPEPADSQQVQCVMSPALVLQADAHMQRVPEMPGETRGVHRSDRLARMLPAEAMLLGHPRLRLVWHARRAERALLCYEDDDRLRERHYHSTPVPRPQPRPAPAPRLAMGPMLVCVDTSGSMEGGAEAVAKAVVLEAVRTAHAQHRPCHVFAFGGEGEVVEMSLALDTDGVSQLARFLGQGFHGGTDICGPIERGLARLEAEDWRLADLLIASDGEFGATPAVAARLQQVRREQGLRVQGVLIGDRETIGLLELSDAIFWVREWRRFGHPGETGRHGAGGEGGEGGGSPVHSSRLTADYFPGALRTPDNLARTLSPEAAAAAVRAGRRRDEAS